jgi:hypothetical protein
MPDHLGRRQFPVESVVVIFVAEPDIQPILM